MPPRKLAKTIFGKRLRESRERADISQEHLGVSIGIDEGSSGTRISRYETGAHEPSIPIAERLAKALGVPLAYFYCPDDELAAIILDASKLNGEGRRRLRKYLGRMISSEMLRT